MLRLDQNAYYERRTIEEMEHGDLAANASLAAIHYVLANRYSILAAPTGKRTPKLTLIDGGKFNSPRRGKSVR